MAVRYEEYDPSIGLSEEILKMFESDHFMADPDYVKIVAWTNKEVDKYNRLVRAHLFGENLPRLIVGDKLIANAPVMEGRQTLIRNNEDMEVIRVEVIEDKIEEDYTLQVYKALVKVFEMDGRLSAEC